MSKPAKERVLVLSDLQAPFQHVDSLPFLEECKYFYQPTKIVCIGDEVDMHAMSDYEHDPDGYSAGHELEAALKFMHKLYKMFPECKSMISNHTARPFRRAHKYGIPRAFLRDYEEFMEAPPGWSWHEKTDIDGVRYEHGDALGGGGATAMRRFPIENGQSTVFGHFHTHAGIIFQSNPQQLMFGMNVGCLIDRKAYAFRYAKSPRRVIISVGIVDEAVPTLQPMLLNKHGRWTGKL